jgi:hypothetical protein
VAGGSAAGAALVAAEASGVAVPMGDKHAGGCRTPILLIDFQEYRCRLIGILALLKPYFSDY